MNALPGAMQKRLSLRQSSPQFRQLRTDHRGIDFLSSDYLGFSPIRSKKKKVTGTPPPLVRVRVCYQAT